MSYWGWKPYVSVAERQKKAEKAAEKAAAKAKKAGDELSPIAPYRGAMAKTFWGKAWGDNLEHYSDYANRLPRGRSYVRNGSVIDLRINAGEVRAKVMGSSLYTVEVMVAAVPARRWKAIGADCAESIDSLVELLQGKLSRAVMERICKAGSGLFPAPGEIKFSCSCPDWASMCKHVAAVLYGVGARLDQQPELLFSLRQVDAKDLVKQAAAGLPKAGKKPAAGRVLDDSVLGDVFGIEIAGQAPLAVTTARRSKPRVAKVETTKAPAPKAPSTKKSASKSAKPVAKVATAVKRAIPKTNEKTRASADKKPVNVKPPVKPAKRGLAKMPG